MGVKMKSGDLVKTLYPAILWNDNRYERVITTLMKDTVAFVVFVGVKTLVLTATGKLGWIVHQDDLFTLVSEESKT